jgi:hypothetical protein
MMTGSRVSLIVLVLILIVIVTYPFVSSTFYLWRNVSNEREQFARRHAEAKEAIEGTYAYFANHDKWPTGDDFAVIGGQAVSLGWMYSSDPEPPVIWLHGPYHMILSYHFEAPNDGKVSNVWTLSCEGDKSFIKAQTPYVVNKQE